MAQQSRDIQDIHGYPGSASKKRWKSSWSWATANSPPRCNLQPRGEAAKKCHGWGVHRRADSFKYSQTSILSLLMSDRLCLMTINLQSYQLCIMSYLYLFLSFLQIFPRFSQTSRTWWIDIVDIEFQRSPKAIPTTCALIRFVMFWGVISLVRSRCNKWSESGQDGYGIHGRTPWHPPLHPS